MPPPFSFTHQIEFMTKKIEQPVIEDERLLDEVATNAKTEASIKDTKKKYRIGWLRNETMRRITKVALEQGNDSKLSSKTAALIILNGFWKITFFYPILWRWFYYFKQYSDDQLAEILAVGKKKVPYIPFLTNTILVTGMRDTIMTMTREEAERIRQGLSGVQQGQ